MDGHRQTVSDHNSSLSTPCSDELKTLQQSQTIKRPQILTTPNFLSVIVQAEGYRSNIRQLFMNILSRLILIYHIKKKYIALIVLNKLYETLKLMIKPE